MVQSQNEAGSYGLARDSCGRAARLFARPIPAELAQALGVARRPWNEVFGSRAEQFFNAWTSPATSTRSPRRAGASGTCRCTSTPRSAARSPTRRGEVGPSGGPNWNALPVWRAAAPHIELSPPTSTTRDQAAVEKFLERYADPRAAVGARDRQRPRISRALSGRRSAGARSCSRRSASTIPAISTTRSARRSWTRRRRSVRRAIPPARPRSRATGRGSPATTRPGAPPRRRRGRPRVPLRPLEGDRAVRPLGLRRGRTGPGSRPKSIRSRINPWAGLWWRQLGPDRFLVTGQHVRLRLALAEAPSGDQAQILSAEEGQFVDGEWR